VVEDAATPRHLHAVDVALARAAHEAGRGTVRVAALGGDVLALGRHHRRPVGATDVAIARRHGAGRAVAAGDGFVSIALHLPHRAALVADHPEAIAPAQVLNRSVRGILGALDALGVPAHYPGRDLVTVGGRAIGVLGFDVTDAGTTTVDAVISVARAQRVLPAFLDRADRASAVPAAMVTARDVTSITEHSGGVAPSLDDVAAALQRGFAARFGIDVRAAASPPLADVDHDAWLDSRRMRPDLDRRVRLPTQLGTLEIELAVADGRILGVQISGDVLVAADALRRVEHALGTIELDVATLRATVRRALAPPHGFLLGVPSPDVLADAIGRLAQG
jgi:lipoate-protein ligase A